MSKADLPPHLSSGSADFLVGDGEMARLVRAKAWAQTPLGPIESWPQSLLTTVSLCLASNFPINIIWGPEANQIYNDGYRVVCGEAHPGALGEDYRVTWASAWPAIGEPFEAARAGQTSFLENQRMFLTRNGYLEETFFTFSLSPIRDETGGIGGLFHPVTETTASMLAERRTRALRDLTANLAAADTVGDVGRLAAATLQGFDFDLPFLLVYGLDGDGGYRLDASFGAPARSALCPETLSAAATSPWPMAVAVRDRQPAEVAGVRDMAGEGSCGPYEEAPERAFVLPLAISASGPPLAVLIAGVSPRLPLDDAYRTFFELIAAAIAAALAQVRTREEERNRAEASSRRELRARIDGVVQLAQRRLEIEQDATTRLRQTEDELAFALEAGRLGSWDINLTTDVLVASPVCLETFGLDPAGAYSREMMVARIHPDDRERRAAELNAAIDGHQNLDLEYRVLRDNGTAAWILMRGRATYDADGQAVRMAGVSLDITERKQAEERQKLLLDELNHRVKNTLATVQSIAMQSRRNAPDPREFSEAFDARVAALANAHDLLTRSSWQGVSFRDMLGLTLQPYADHAINLSGPPVVMGPNAAVTLNMAFHELATNAAKYGALSSPDGAVDVSWSIDRTAEPPAIVTDWRELGGPPVTPPSRSGFGTRLLEQGMPRELGGTVTLNYGPDGFSCRMRIPLSQKIQAPGA